MSSARFIARPVKLVVVPEGKPIFDELVTEVAIDDDVGGEFLTLTQEDEDGRRTLKFDLEEWPAIVRAGNRMLREIRKHRP